MLRLVVTGRGVPLRHGSRGGSETLLRVLLLSLLFCVLVRVPSSLSTLSVVEAELIRGSTISAAHEKRRRTERETEAGGQCVLLFGALDAVWCEREGWHIMWVCCRTFFDLKIHRLLGGWR